jgi:alpha-D-ribose 1-methylphosphonate 5-triphosphate synthase subunit PhnH
MNVATTAGSLRPAFPSPVFDSQATFRAVLEAMSKPGTLQTVPVLVAPPPPLDPATVAVGLTLFDFETPVWLGDRVRGAEAADYLRFHTGCPIVDEPGAAAFALFTVPGDAIDLAELDLGSDEYPDRSTTAIIQVAAIDDSAGLELRGPGISGVRRLEIAEIPDDFWRTRREIESLFPRGADLIFATGRTLAAVPRSTRLEA